MAYTKQQFKEHIKELQRYLHGISYYNPRVPTVIPDGIYGNETQTAVRAFQREYNLRETGKADMPTWNSIVRTYRNNVNSEAEMLDLFPSAEYIVKIGDTGFIIYVIQIMLRVLSDIFDNIGSPEITGVYNQETAREIKNFQELTNLRTSGAVDRPTWNMLVKTSQSNHL
ncbi:MAG: peptidoglycan-binding protein [Ruminococcus sp.]|nr:peptidoglycan-binding protein [Ruminococcus sp.]MBO5383829.1 peptidoglycan-binding protein [Ruminococcus sp.]MBR6669575.1 peptidoglycan-binding protein [Ruminococcus sp.]